MATSSQIKAALDLMRRLPPKDIETSISEVLTLAPEITDDLLSSVDQPLKVVRCCESGKDFLICDYNRDGDSYRSPWSNTYQPPLHDGIVPPEDLRRMEVAANLAFEAYREQYYEGGCSSVYVWATDAGFACCVAISKDGEPTAHAQAEGADPATATISTGNWSSIHVIDAVVNDVEKRTKYKLTTTVMLSFSTACESQRTQSDLSGNLTRTLERERSHTVGDLLSHISNMGELIEEMEGRMRDALDEIYFGKTLEILRAIRPPADDRRQLQQSLMAEMALKRRT